LVWRELDGGKYMRFTTPYKILTMQRFYIVGVVWNLFVATVIFFTYLETKGLTLEQIDQRFNGVPRDELVDITEVFNGTKPISDGEIDNKLGDKKVSETPVEITKV
jgi:hypothetical protein